jgi:hypothetical protein
MPTEAPLGVTYDFNARRLGNQMTCDIQGFVSMLGLVTSFAYNGTLGMYYLVAIGLRWKEDRILKHEFLFFHLLPLILGLITAIITWGYHNYNPSGLGLYCTMTVLGCDGNVSDGETKNYKRGNERAYNFMMTTLIVLVGILFCSLLTFFGIILGSVWWSTNTFVSHEKQSRDQQQDLVVVPHTSTEEDRRDADQNSCSLLIQIVAYMIPLVLSFLFQGWVILDHGYCGLHTFHGFQTSLYLIFSSLQGFFNMLDFLGHKVRG